MFLFIPGFLFISVSDKPIFLFLISKPPAAHRPVIPGMGAGSGKPAQTTSPASPFNPAVREFTALFSLADHGGSALSMSVTDPSDYRSYL